MPDAVQKRCLTIIVPALNEEEKIEQTVADLLPIARATLDDYEVFLIDDGSCDETGSIMERLAADDPRVHVHHNSTPHGLPWMVREYIARSRFHYLAMVVGDGVNSTEALRRSFEAVGSADLIVGYRTNQQRPWFRQCVSIGFRVVMTMLYGSPVKDWSGYFIWPVEKVRGIGPFYLGNSYSVEVLVKMFRRHPGLSVKQIPMPQNPEGRGSTMVTWRTARDVCHAVWRLTTHRR